MNRESRTGVWLVGGRGSVATTALTGAAAVAAGLAEPTGLVTMRAPFADARLPVLGDLGVGGHGVARPAAGRPRVGRPRRRGAAAGAARGPSVGRRRAAGRPPRRAQRSDRGRRGRA